MSEVSGRDNVREGILSIREGILSLTSHYKINHEFWEQTDDTIVLIAILSPRNNRFMDKKLICVGIESLFYFHARTFVTK